jgi:hypothetical protein
MAVYRKALFRDRNQTIKRTLFTLQRRPDALRGVFQALNRREFTLNTLNCPICVLSNRTILTLSCRHPELGTVVLDDSIPDSELRTAISARLPSDDVGKLVDGCRALRAGNEGSHLGLVHHWYGYTRKYSPVFIERTPFPALGNRPSA